MTAQRQDTIIINEKEYIMYGFPLQQYWDKYNNKLPLFSFTTSLNRGYYAQWQILDNKLFLIDFFGEYIWPFPGKKYSLSDLFPPGNDKIFAEWFSGDIQIPLGKQIDYIHAGWGGIYEYRTTISITNGLVTDPGLFCLL